jgi:hypothetical protein
MEAIGTAVERAATKARRDNPLTTGSSAADAALTREEDFDYSGQPHGCQTGPDEMSVARRGLEFFLIVHTAS